MRATSLPSFAAVSIAEVSAQAAPAEAGTLSAAHVRVPAGMRAWARTNGFEIGNRGRLPLEVLDAYRHAHDVPAGR